MIISCSISTSSFDTTAGSSVIDCSCLAPFITTVTMPPPAVASTRSSAICFCSRSCICCACFIICWMFIGSHFLDFLDVRAEDVEHRLDPGVGHRLLLQLGLLV